MAVSATRSSSSAVWATSGQSGDADGGGKPDGQTVRRQKRVGPDAVPDALGDSLGAFGARVRQDQRELVAAEPGDDVGFTGAAADDSAGLHERLAARQMAVVVVDLLEAVEVEEQHRQRTAAAHRALGLAPQHLVEVARIGQQRQIVGDRQRVGLLRWPGRCRARWRPARAMPRSASISAAPSEGASADGCGSMPTSTPVTCPRQSRGRASTVPCPRPPPRESLARSATSSSVPWLITHSAAAHSDGPRPGFNPMSAITVGRSLRSRATTAQHGAGNHEPPCRTSHSLTLPGSVDAFASRIAWDNASRVDSRTRSAVARDFQRADGSGRRAPRTMRGALAAFRPPVLAARCGVRAGTWERQVCR